MNECEDLAYLLLWTLQRLSIEGNTREWSVRQDCTSSTVLYPFSSPTVYHAHSSCFSIDITMLSVLFNL